MRVYVLVLCVSAALAPGVRGQEQCFGGGSVAGAAVGAFLGALLLVVAAYYLRKLYWKSRKGKHLVFSTDPESVKDEFAFDNPGFRQDERAGWQHDAATLPLGAGGGKQHALSAEFTKPREKISSAVSKDDLQAEKSRVRTVKLWARDFTGLGLRAVGGAREGVRVHSVLRAGPAAAAGIQPGDKIKSIKIELTGTVLDDAVGILSLASPYPVELEIEESVGAGGGKTSGEGRSVEHPLLKRHGSVGDVHTLEKELRHLHPPRSPNTTHSNNSTLETKNSKGGIKKIITEKIITTTTLERAKKEKERLANSTLERENEKNVKLANKNRHSEGPVINKPERNKTRHSTGSEIHIIQPENGIMAMDKVQKAETQKKDYDPKRGMKFGIRVLPPNIPDDGVIKTKIENGNVNIQERGIDEPDKMSSKNNEMRVENEVTDNKTKPVVAKRREKLAPPVPNARNLSKNSDSELSMNSKMSEQSVTSSFLRDDLNSSGIRRDENGIPQELPQHMLEAAMFARNNRKSEYIDEPKASDSRRDSDIGKPNKKSKGKAPSPPEYEKNKTDDSIVEQLKNINQFLDSEKLHSSVLHDSSMLNPEQHSTSYNTSTPKNNKYKKNSVDESINFSQDDIDDIVSKPFKRESDSLNNFYEDSKSNLSSNLDIASLNNSDKGSTTIELNNSDITIHSSPTNDTLQSASDNASILDENERKAASLGDLSRFENRGIKKPSQGTLERAQSLDISADEIETNEKVKSPKRKAKSVVEATFFDSTNMDDVPDMIDSETIIIKSKEPRLSLNLAKTSAMEGLSTFQRNRLKHGSEFGNLEDAIVKGSNSSLDSDKEDTGALQKHKDYGINIRNNKFDTSKLTKLDKHTDETSDHLAKRIMDENLKVHFKLVSEFAKSTSDGSNFSSMDNEPKSDILYTAQPVTTDFPSSLSMTYDTNIPDDMKVSRHTLVNSLERPKSDMMKKLLAKNPALNVHIDEVNSDDNDQTKSIPDPSKAPQQPDIVNFNPREVKSPFKTSDVDDFVSNIRIGSNNNSLNYNEKKNLYEADWSEKTQIDKQNNIVTITTKERSESPLQKNDEFSKGFTKSIEIGERQIPDVIEEVSRSMKIRSDNINDPMIVSNSRTYFTEDPTMNLEITQTKEPIQKTVTVNVAEDEFGNKIITQNIEQISMKHITTKTEAPLQVEQISFGMIKSPKDIQRLNMEEAEDIKELDEKILHEIKRQNPNMHFTTDEPAYSKTETIILNTNLDEADALALMDKLKTDPNFMAQRSAKELSQMGVRVIHDLEDNKVESANSVEVTKTRYTINPMNISAHTEKCPEPDHSQTQMKTILQSKINEQKSEANKNHITEIQVMTPHTEKLMKQKSDLSKPEKPKSTNQYSKARSNSYSEPELSYELDISLLNDFISNERRHSAKEIADLHRQQKKAEKETRLDQHTSRHSDYDLPRNTQIMFRTATYESPKGTIVTSTDIENRRLSQIEQMRTNFEPDSRNTPSPTKPTISAKPSNIPVKQQDKPKTIVSPSKIPVFMSQKSQSQENLTDKSLSLSRNSPPQLSGSSGNISVTSIVKSSSRNPSGK